MDIITFENLQSTNTYAKEHIDELKHLTCIRAIKQNKGKGRRQNQWLSNHESLTFSIVLKEKLQVNDIEMASLKTGYLLLNFLKKYTNNALIKWPNDILLKGKKVAGILVETIYQNTFKALVIGIGINVNQENFPTELKDMATSLYREGKHTYDLEKFLSEWLDFFEKHYKTMNHDNMIEGINNHLAYKNQIINYLSHDQFHKAKCIKVSDQGHLLVEENNQQLELTSEEISKIRN
jgi:BirA family biotin operon repressor/biotin-[acetyl-CoA-carboxylase] ligase